MSECDRLGRDAFLERYGFRRAVEYFLRHDGREYDSKAVVGVAHGYQHPDEGPLGPQDFSGGARTVGGLLVRLGFDVDGMSRDETDWSPEEVEILVRDYFEMLAMELRGESFRKSDHYNALIPLLNGRSKQSVEYKYANASFVLDEMNLPFIEGYKPRSNRQGLLVGCITEFLEDHPGFFDTVAPRPADAIPELVPPPAPARDEPALRGAKMRRAAKVDFALRDALNRELGRAGEEEVVRYEQARLTNAGRPDLAERVFWLSREKGDGAGYDVASFDPEGPELFIEVKTTNGGAQTPFYVSTNKIDCSSDKGDRFAVYRLYGAAGRRKLYILRGPIDRTCVLTATVSRALPRAVEETEALKPADTSSA